MDFWSRLIAGTSLSSSPGSKASSANKADKRRARFQREYNQLLQIWRSTVNLSRDQDAAEAVRGIIQELTSILIDESISPSPHLCISDALKKQIYIPVGKIATTSYNEPIIREAVAFFSTLIESEEEDFLESDAFSKSLMNLLVRITGANSIRLGLDAEVAVVELAYGIAAKIRLQPEILPTWFTAHGEAADEEYKDAHERFAGKTHKEDFPLVYLLLDYIHHEGRIGDFARTGLLYIIESASTSLSLEQWVIESDLATLMATGLGALYSQLSRKLVIDYPADELPSILALSDYERPVTTAEIVSSASLDFQGHMDTFLSHLAFWQDVLARCKSVEVKQTLLEHFQVIFLQQLLYPSLLESSDVDGGSSVAVLTYLRRILESLDHPDMIHLILHYLLALPDATPVRTSASRAVSAARRRKSMDLATMMASQSEAQATPALFNLVDLILSCLRSKSQQTIAVTLQLVSVILRRHHRYAVTTLLRTGRLMTEEPQRTIGIHEREMDYLLSLASEIGGDEDFNEAYENHVKDSMTLLESHPCSQSLIALKTGENNSKLLSAQLSIPGGPREVVPHTLRPDDPMFRIILSMLETFFINPVETNLCLTAAIIDLAACGFMGIEGWLLPDPSTYTYESAEEEDDMTMTITLSNSPEASERAQLHAIRLAQRTPTWPPSNLPPLLTHLQTLTSQISTYRSEIPRFDDLLQQRRQLFHTHSAEDTPIPIRQPPPRTSFESSTSGSGSSPPSKQSAFDSLAQRIFPELATPSRSSSPRGRRSQDQQRSSSGYGIGTSTPLVIPSSKAPRIVPAQFPMGSLGPETPSRGNSRAFSPSPLRGSESTSAALRGIASQVAAFAEVDRMILTRKVGIPTAKGELVPVPFPNLSKSTQDQDTNVPGQTIDETGNEDADEEGETKSEEQEEVEQKLVTVSHVLTNVMVLQEFLLELAAVVQVRAGLFGEVKFA